MAFVVTVFIALLVGQVLCTSMEQDSFSARLALTAEDRSTYVITWDYDANRHAEKVVYHREGGANTVELHLYALGVAYFLVDNTCYQLPIDNKIPSSAERFADLTKDTLLVKWVDASSIGAVGESNFEIPAACANPQVQGGIFCSTCQSVGQSVVNLGCNATAAEIAKLCGNIFAGVCKSVLDELCSGTCQIEECATDACCLFELCDGATCANSTSSSTSSASMASSQLLEGGAAAPQEPQVSGDPFCASCLTVGAGVISLGCNATTAEIAKLCGALFVELCQKVLETACSGACEIEDCPRDACCAIDLCTGSDCVAPSTTTSSNTKKFY